MISRLQSAIEVGAEPARAHSSTHENRLASKLLTGREESEKGKGERGEWKGRVDEEGMQRCKTRRNAKPRAT
jgi:hypothetical protein